MRRRMAALTAALLAFSCLFAAVPSIAEGIELTGSGEVESLPDKTDVLGLTVDPVEFVAGDVTQAGDFGEAASPDVALNAIPSALKLGVKETYKLSASGATFKSSRTSVATVSRKGVITARKKGTARITVTSGGKTVGACTVKVLAAPAKVSLDRAKADVEIGDTLQLKARLPGKTTSNKLTWRSSREKVATVDDDGRVTAVSAGTAKITVRTYNGKKASCTVTVKKASPVIGDIVVFGHYDQDNDAANGKEDIDWLVLHKTGDALTLISRYALDCKPYNDVFVEVTWETCTLRKWLNGDFLNEAFTASEQAHLKRVDVPAEDNPYTGAEAGNNTRNMVYLLSIDDVNNLLASDDKRVCFPTQTALANGATTRDGACWWWLRSPGDDQYSAAFVEYVKGYGPSLNVPGRGVQVTDHAVRPVICLKLL